MEVKEGGKVLRMVRPKVRGLPGLEGPVGEEEKKVWFFLDFTADAFDPDGPEMQTVCSFGLWIETKLPTIPPRRYIHQRRRTTRLALPRPHKGRRTNVGRREVEGRKTERDGQVPLHVPISGCLRFGKEYVSWS